MASHQTYQQRETMPAVSKAQRRFMAILEHDPAKLKDSGMSKQQAHDFAATKEKGLPEHVKPKKRKYYKQSG
jgi:hypothetical protein